WHDRPYLPAAARPRPSGEFPAVEPQALPQPEQPAARCAVAVTAAGLAAAPVVADRDHELLAPLHAHTRRGLPGMPQHVGEPFLHDPVSDQVRARRQGPGRTADPELNREPDGRHPAAHSVELAEPPLRPRRPRPAATTPLPA